MTKKIKKRNENSDDTGDLMRIICTDRMQTGDGSAICEAIESVSGLEKSTRPLVFTSESPIRASENLPWLARQDE